MVHQLRILLVTTLCLIFFVVLRDGRAFPEDGHRVHTHSAKPHTHEKYRQIKNPVLPGSQTMKEGCALYVKHCSSCHGETGKGDGPAAGALNPRPSDFTDSVWIHGETDGEVAHVINRGISHTAMKGYERSIGKDDPWKLAYVVKGFTGSTNPCNKSD